MVKKERDCLLIARSETINGVVGHHRKTKQHKQIKFRINLIIEKSTNKHFHPNKATKT